MFKRFLRFINNPSVYLNKRARFTYMRKFLARILPPTLRWDEFYSKYTFRKFFGYKLDLISPKTFNEKIRWLSLYNRNPLYEILADKLRVRDYVEERIGSSYLNPIIGVYDGPHEIEWGKLPNRFAIRMNHGSSWNLICHDKNKFNKIIATKKLAKWLSKNFYFEHREWLYKNIPPKILVEEYIEGDPNSGLWDYRIYCFSGQPKFIQIDAYGYTNHTRVIYDTEWNQVAGMHYQIPPFPIQKPKKLKELMFLAKKLADGIVFCRVDFYLNKGNIVFGEITISAVAGYAEFQPEKYDLVFGNLIDLPIESD